MGTTRPRLPLVMHPFLHPDPLSPSLLPDPSFLLLPPHLLCPSTLPTSSLNLSQSHPLAHISLLSLFLFLRLSLTNSTSPPHQFS